jgi:hypothetical protein
VTDEELAAIHQALGDLIQAVRRRGLPRHIEGKIESVQDMIRLVMVSDDYPDEWG